MCEELFKHINHEQHIFTTKQSDMGLRCHVFNSLSIFSTGESSITSSIILIAMCLGYTIYINKKVKA
jgi:hypothetical protein